MVTVKELKGLKSIYAVNALSSLVYGLASEQAHLGQGIEETYAKFEQLDEAGQRIQLKHALQVVNLTQDDMLNLLCFALDPNGVPYDETRVKNMAPTDIMDAMLEVACKVAQTVKKTRSITEDSKKNCQLAV